MLQPFAFEVLLICFGFVCLSGLALNVLMLIAIFKYKDISVKDFAFNINLAVADLLTSLSGIILLAIRAGSSWQLQGGICQVYGFTVSFSSALSVFTLLAMAISHFLSFCYGVKFSAMRCVIALFVCWFASMWTPVIPMLLGANPLFVAQPSGLYCIIDFVAPLPHFTITIPITLLLAPFVIAVLYFFIWKTLVQQSLSSISAVCEKDGPSDDQLAVMNDAVSQINLVIIRRALLLCSSFAFVWYVPAILMIYQILNRLPISPELDAIAAFMLFFKDSVNPLLFFYMDKRCYTSLCRMFKDDDPENRRSRVPRPKRVGHARQVVQEPSLDKEI